MEVMREFPGVRPVIDSKDSGGVAGAGNVSEADILTAPKPWQDFHNREQSPGF